MPIKTDLMKKAIVVAMTLASCTTSSKINAVRQRNQARISSATAESTAYRFPSIYTNVGTVVPDTTVKSH
jgi:hypothetical protein